MMVDAPPDDSAALRRRAGSLRVLAARIERSVLHDAVHVGGDLVWRGPAADDYRLACQRGESLLADAAAGLRRAAHLVEQTALEIDGPG
ncbi:MAG: hypothetical protein QOD72_2072 [Acidimicrobiaceae bacterium]|nr:hypothetical protein [Acidimicrobiaceae bacterium]